MGEQPQVTPRPKVYAQPKRKQQKRAAFKRPDQHAVEVRKDVIARSGGRCEMDPVLPAVLMHHRKRAGRIDSVENLLHLSERSHGVVHANVAWSERHGLLVRSWEDPALVPIHIGCPLSCEVDHR